jgi:hypothetical protein
VGPPGARLQAPAAELSPGPPNGDFAAGLAGWTALGRQAPEALAPGVRLRANTTLVSAPLTVPAGAQTLDVTARATGRGALLQVRARPEDGGGEVVLGTLEPGPAARRDPIGVAAVAGRAVRLVLDPVPALGASLDVLRVGPVTAPLPGWSVGQGALEVAARRVRVREERLDLAAPAVRPGPAARALIVAVRGEGTLRLRAAGRRVAGRAGARWRDLRVPLPRRPGAVVLRIEALPGPGGLELRDLGLVRRATLARGLRAAASRGGLAVRGRLVPAGGRLRVELRDRRGRRVARGRSDPRGALALRAPAGSAPLTLVVPGDRTRIGARFPVPSR